MLYVDPEGGEEGTSYVGSKKDKLEREAVLYPMINGIAISGKRIDTQRPTKVLVTRERLRELRKKIAR